MSSVLVMVLLVLALMGATATAASDSPKRARISGLQEQNRYLQSQVRYWRDAYYNEVVAYDRLNDEFQIVLRRCLDLGGCVPFEG